MIRRTAVLAAACGFLTFVSRAPAAAGVAPLVEKLEAATEEERLALGRGLVETGPEGVRELVRMLVDPGTGDDTKARMALHALAYHASRPGAEAERRMFAGALAGEFAGDVTPEVKGYLVRMLRLAGGRESVEVLGGLLLAGGLGDRAGENNALAEYAAQALLTMGSEGGRGVAAEFRTALPKARGPARLTVLQALGVLRDRQSVPRLLEATKDTDREVRLAALWGLGNIGAVEATETLLEAAMARPRYERAKATAALLLLAERLTGRDRMRELALFLRRLVKRHSAPAGRLFRGERVRRLGATAADACAFGASQLTPRAGAAEAERIYRHLWETRNDPLDRHLKCAALGGLARVLGGDAFDQLREAMQSDDVEIRAVATDAAVTTPGRGLTLKWIDELRTGAPETKAGTLAILGRRGDRAALPAVLEVMKGADEKTQLAAIDAVAQLGGTEAVAPLVGILASDNEGERKAAQLALQRIPGPEVTGAVAESVAGSPPAARGALLEVLAARGGKEHVEVVLACTKDADRSVRLAALESLGLLASAETLPKLVDLLQAAGDAKERRAAEKSLATVSTRLEDKEACVDALLRPMPRAGVQPKCSLLRVLGRLGGERALEAVRRASRDAEPDVKDAAIRTLAEWPDASAADDLFSIARSSSSMSHKVIALRGYVRAVGLPSGRSSTETLAMYRQAMRISTRPEEKKLVLAGLAGVGSLEALKMAERFMGEAVYREEAAAAAVKIARAVSGEHRDRAMAALRKVWKLSKSDAVRKQAAEVIDHIERFDDYITSWMVSGPYVERGKGGQALFKVPFAPEKPGGKANWQLWTGRGDRPWFVDINRIDGVRGDNRVAYLRAKVRPPVAQEAVLEFGSDDGLKVWLDGEPVHSNDVMRGFKEAEDKVNVRLKAGWNTLLLKVNNGGGDFSVACRIRAADGGKIKGLRMKAE